MKVVILCGGKGTRLREETEFRPKPMLPIGDRPILWHIMKTYATFGHTEFVLCLGYKGDMIKDYFRNYLWMVSDVTLRLGRKNEIVIHDSHDEEDWTVTLADTGEETLTAGRIHRIRRYVADEPEFFLTYGDGVGNISINDTLKFHRQHGKVLTTTAVHPAGRFGELALRPDQSVAAFDEKPQTEAGWISGGYLVASQKVFDYLGDDPDHTMFEREPIQRITADGQLMAHLHTGFWQPMDTFSEFNYLNRLWQKGTAPWKVW